MVGPVSALPDCFLPQRTRRTQRKSPTTRFNNRDSLEHPRDVLFVVASRGRSQESRFVVKVASRAQFSVSSVVQKATSEILPVLEERAEASKRRRDGWFRGREAQAQVSFTASTERRTWRECDASRSQNGSRERPRLAGIHSRERVECTLRFRE